ncbi:hypothetical protein K432DRAFT_114919 [Lepidopterella palustris CBS 459.81]|uniref:LisH domain-containing protein n=1 Tax=Lepidopterella palustris CBS 459.81 TaxID=1314670 RepID=A0A8E2E5D6_9PEZI|nr:hypothetical protein K432DRAFT_114919 [Lepidopterella palustris CBS 459.81]
MLPSAAIIVARFLRTNGYNETLTVFLNEAGLPPDAGSTSKGDFTIEQILQEKRQFDLSTNFEKLGVDGEEKGWHLPAPSIPAAITTLPSTSNLLTATIERLHLPGWNVSKQCLLASTADRRLNLIKPDRSSYELFRSYTHLQDAPILGSAVLDHQYLLLSSMSGKVRLYDSKSETLLDERRDHTKYVVKVISWRDSESAYIATAGWDAKVVLYHMSLPADGEPRLGDPLATLDLPSNPEAILFIAQPESSRPLLLLTRRDSTFLYFYALPPLTEGKSEILLLGKQNLAPHSNSWVAFTPAAVALCPTDASLLAVATSTVPHMRLIIVRLLLPPPASLKADSAPESPEPYSRASPQSGLSIPDAAAPTQASQARAALIVKDREDAAILVQCSTLAPQTQYSTPTLAWRPDGSGVWVNSDDGIIRGIEASTGKVVAALEGHEVGSKIRCLWAGWVEVGEDDDQRMEEWIVSGGFDQRLIVWTVW